MKPELEIITPIQQQHSIHFFEVVTAAFKPYWHYHPELELTLITKGKGTRFVGNSILPYEEGDLVLIGQNLPHHWVSAEESEEQAAIVLQFPASLFLGIKECAQFNSFFEQAAVGFHFKAPNKALLQHFHAFSKASAIGRIGLLMQLLEALQNDKNRVPLSTISYASGRQIAQQQTKVSQTINYILDHLDKRLTVQEMSEVAHMVPQSFCRWFKKSVGMSFVTFVNTARIERTCHDVQNTDKPMSAIAFENGFESLSHFNRTFKKIKGEAPTTYKARMVYHV